MQVLDFFSLEGFLEKLKCFLFLFSIDKTTDSKKGKKKTNFYIFWDGEQKISQSIIEDIHVSIG